DDGHDGPPAKQKGEGFHITLTQALEAAIERSGGPREEACRAPIVRAMTLTLEQQADRDRRQGPRQSVGSQHRKYDGNSKWREQVLGRPVEEYHGREHATDGKSRN